jgi:hypothetical protein
MWQTLFKWVAQFLLLPLIKDGAIVLRREWIRRKELKRLKEENAKKGDAYENSSPEDAHDEFSRLP